MFPEEFRTPSFRSAFLSVSQRDFEDLPANANMLICAGHILKCSKRSHDGLGLRPKPCSWYLRCHSLAQQACPVLRVTFIPNWLPFPLASMVCGQYSFSFACDSMFFTSFYPLIMLASKERGHPLLPGWRCGVPRLREESRCRWAGPATKRHVVCLLRFSFCLV